MDSYKYEPMAEIMSLWETIKKYKHGKYCNNQQKHCFTACYFSRCNAQEESPSRTCTIEFNRGSKNGRTPFASTGVGKLSNHNRGREILLTYDLWSLTTQSPVGKGAGLGSVIENWVGKLNITPS